jgi:membrane protein
VVVAVVPDSSRDSAVESLNDRLQLSDAAASAVGELIARPPGAAASITVVGAVLLLVSVVGFTRSLQRTYLAAWELPSLGLPGFGYGLLGAIALVAEVVALLFVAPLLAALPGAVVLTALARLVPSVLVWWPLQRLLLAGRVGWRALLPGAVASGVGQVVVMTVSGVYVAGQIDQQAARFGLIGVAFVLVTWLIALGLLLVLGAVVGAELAAGRVEVSRRDGRCGR